VGDLSATYFAMIKGGAKARGIKFDIDINTVWQLFIAQHCKCELTGLEIALSRSTRQYKIQEQTASLDRIDSTKGYVLGNVQWVHKDVNRMKNAFTQERFIEVCNLVSKLHQAD
jgi:hypothetical protein